MDLAVTGNIKVTLWCLVFCVFYLAIPATANRGETGPIFSRMDSLFLTAATGEPRLKEARLQSESLLVDLKMETVHYLLAHRVVDQTPRQRHYVERLFDLLSDSGRNLEPGKALTVALEKSPDTVKSQLLYIASTMADTSLRDLGLRYISNPEVEVRRMAARVIGMYPNRIQNSDLQIQANALLKNLTKASEIERHQRLWALAQIAPFSGCDSLSFFAQDSSLAVRQMANQALTRCRGDKVDVKR